LHVLHQVWVRVIGQNDGVGALDGADDAGDAGCGADLEDVFASDEVFGSFFDVVCAGSAGVPEEVALE
jgi:hypothetical protein